MIHHIGSICVKKALTLAQSTFSGYTSKEKERTTVGYDKNTVNSLSFLQLPTQQKSEPKMVGQ